MKCKIFLEVCTVLFVSCTGEVKKKCVLDQYPIEHCKLDVHEIDSVMVCPQAINVFEDKLLVMEPQKAVSKISVFDRNQFDFLFSDMDEGRTKYEVMNLRSDYYAHTDTSFFVLDNNMEKEYGLHVCLR